MSLNIVRDKRNITHEKIFIFRYSAATITVPNRKINIQVSRDKEETKSKSDKGLSWVGFSNLI